MKNNHSILRFKKRVQAGLIMIGRLIKAMRI